MTVKFQRDIDEWYRVPFVVFSYGTAVKEALNHAPDDDLRKGVIWHILQVGLADSRPILAFNELRIPSESGLAA